MEPISMFWQSVRRRAYCGDCEYQRDAVAYVPCSSTVTLQRSHHESRAYFECPNCGNRGVYLRRGRTQSDATRGALRVRYTDHEPNLPVPGSPEA